MSLAANNRESTPTIEEVIGDDSSQIDQEQLTPQELAKLGTHEYKLEDWFHKFKQLLDATLHPHQIVGRLALRLSTVSSSSSLAYQLTEGDG